MALRLDRRSHDRDLLCHREMGARSLSRQRSGRVGLWSGELVNHTSALDLLFIANPTFRGGVYAGLRRSGRSSICSGQIRRADNEQIVGIGLSPLSSLSAYYNIKPRAL